jgi:uracil-DNA glycosylase
LSLLFKHVPPQLPASGRCKIAFVGDFPSDHDLLKGKPFMGADGRTLDQILRVAGLAGEGGMVEARSAFLVTNVFDTAIPDEAFAPATERKKWTDYPEHLTPIRGSGYLRPEYLSHLDRLTSQLQAARSNLIVPLGAVALWSLTGVSDISLARGAVGSATQIASGVKLLPTYHPRHVAQDHRLFHVAVLDFVKAAAQAEFSEVRLVKRKIHIRPTVADLARWEERLFAADSLAVDIETAKQQITCIGFAPSPAESFVIPFADYERASNSYWSTAQDEACAWDTVRRLVESDIPKIMQNGLYDAYYLIRQAGIYPKNYSEDTRLMHHALYPELPKSLAFMGATYAQQGPWKLLNSHGKEDKKDA